MPLITFFAIIQRRWPLLVGLPLVVALLSFAVGWLQPKHYQSSTRVIAARGVTDPNSTAGMTWAREDTVAQDLPTIINSQTFAHDVAQELARTHNMPFSEAQVAAALQAANDGKIVTIHATANKPEEAVAIAQATVTVLQANGLRYWGDPTWTPEHPGVNIGPLDPPSAPVAIPTLRQVALDAALRAFAGLLVALGLAYGFEYLGKQKMTSEMQAVEKQHVAS